MTKRKYVIILAIITIICMITGVCLYIISPAIVGNGVREKQCEDISSFERIIIDGTYMDIEIKNGNGYQVSYICKSGPEPEIYVNGATLRVERIGKAEKNDCKVIITVPKHLAISYTEIDIISGDISLSDINLVDVKVDVMSGDIQIEDIVSITTNLNTGIGDIYIESDNISRVYAKSKVGDIRMITNDGKVDRKVNLIASSGKAYYFDVIKDLSYAASPVTVVNHANLTTDSGNVYYNAEIDK